jgi:thiamine biosynthesis lipoprotein
MRHVFETMGTVATLEIAHDRGELLAEAKAVFSRVDARFSLHRADSEISRIAAGSLSLVDSSDEFRRVYGLALTWRSRTGGAFTPHRPDGAIDLNGIVKAEAMRECGERLDAAACRDWSVCVGGDILISSARQDGSPRNIGVVDPNDRSQLACSVVLAGSRRAIATSGSAERGEHIWFDHDSVRPQFVQTTVVADDIVTADVLATAIIAGGVATLDDITDQWDVDAFTVDREGTMLATPGFRMALALA